MAKQLVHHKNSFATSLSRLDFEKTVAPGQTVAPSTNDYQWKDLPPIPQSNLRRALSDQSPRGYGPNGKSISYSQGDDRVDGESRPPIRFKSHSLPDSVSRLEHKLNRRKLGNSIKKGLHPPPPPPMSQSARKIMQLTGFDPSFDQEPRSHYSVSPESSESEESQYSQPESELHEYVPPQSQRTTFTRGEPGGVYLQSSFYSATEGSASISSLSIAAVAAASGPATSLRTRDRPLKQKQRGINLTGADSADNLTNEELMAVEMARYAQQKRTRLDDGFERDIESRYRHEMTGAERRNLVPLSLAIMPRSRTHDENENLDRRYTNPHSPTSMPYDRMQVCSRMPPVPQRSNSRKRFGTGKHWMKSTFPSTSQKDPEERKPEQNVRKRFSGAMKRLSGGRKYPEKPTVITNRQREAGGPDTPLPSSSGFSRQFFPPAPDILQKAPEQLQDAVEKAKKSLRIKTADERRREDLKNQIVVVGITDQSPGTRPSLSRIPEADDSRDGRVSEWL